MTPQAITDEPVCITCWDGEDICDTCDDCGERHCWRCEPCEEEAPDDT